MKIIVDDKKHAGVNFNVAQAAAAVRVRCMRASTELFLWRELAQWLGERGFGGTQAAQRP
ncbi:MAG: hypothetical protein JJU00_01615 [Opitutales bacterium]|nr:hypothetical protein [Opitutales bacterium]